MSKRSVRRVASGAFLVLALCPPFFAQRATRPEPTLVQDVYLGREADEAKKVSLVLRDGAIERVLEAGTSAPPGVRIVDGRGLFCLPAFLDAYSNTGSVTPEPVADQDQPVDVGSDVRIDMRQANRKGLQPAFAAVEALAIEKDASQNWRKAGFGVALVAPKGELLAGTSALVATREAAMRDLVLKEKVFAHGAFQASGRGYPSTLMGYIAQLRQFLHDAGRQEELERRYAQGRPGLRPPHDAELQEGGRLLSKERLLVCEAETSRDMERWFKLADEFGLRIGFSGGLQAWRVTTELRERDVPLILTLDWGKEVEDPLAKKKKKDKQPGKRGESEEADPQSAGADASQEVEEQEDPDQETAEVASAQSGGEEAGEPVWEYTEPLGVRLDKRREWLEGRDCALRLAEAGVSFTFGSKARDPGKLLEDVRSLVEAGLPADKALTALTSDAARLLGVSNRLGRVAAGYDATFCLWRSDPLVDDKAEPAWTFVDGFPTEFEEKKKDKADQGPPAEGVDVSGTWALVFPEGEAITEAKLVLKMDAEGEVAGSIFMKNPQDESEVEGTVEGSLSGNKLILETKVSFGEMTIELGFSGTVDGDVLEGESSFQGAWMDEPRSDPFTATRQPERVR